MVNIKTERSKTPLSKVTEAETPFSAAVAPNRQNLRTLERVRAELNTVPGGPELDRKLGLGKADQAPPLPGITRSGKLLMDIATSSDRPGLPAEIKANNKRMELFGGLSPDTLRSLIYPNKN